MTIPLMKNVGYRPQMAGAVEAVASTGGQIMPPVMGAGAFIMAEVLGLTYTKIIVAATIPAILYYFALYWMIDFEALRYNLKGIPRAELPKASAGFVQQGHLLLPIVVLLFSLIVMETSPIRAGLWSSLSIILVSFIRRATHMGWGKISEALEGGAKGILEVAATCACAGIIIGVMALTGLGGRISGRVDRPFRELLDPGLVSHHDRLLHPGHGPSDDRRLRDLRQHDRSGPDPDGSSPLGRSHVHLLFCLPVGHHPARGSGSFCRGRDCPDRPVGGRACAP